MSYARAQSALHSAHHPLGTVPPRGRSHRQQWRRRTVSRRTTHSHHGRVTDDRPRRRRLRLRRPPSRRPAWSPPATAYVDPPPGPRRSVFAANGQRRGGRRRRLPGARAAGERVPAVDQSRRDHQRNRWRDVCPRACRDHAKAVSACKAAGVRRLLQMSGLNADPAGPSRYLRSKGEAEGNVAASGLDWTIFRPSVIFGPDDSFLNLFARLSRTVPILALGSPKARFQPVYVGDVASCFVHATTRCDDRPALCVVRPEGLYAVELVRYVGEITDSPRPILTLGPGLSKFQALALERLPGKLMSRDNLASMQRDSVCGCHFPAVFGLGPTALEAVAPAYLAPAATRSSYDELPGESGRCRPPLRKSQLAPLLPPPPPPPPLLPPVKIFRVGGSVRDELLGPRGRRPGLGRRRRDARRAGRLRISAGRPRFPGVPRSRDAGRVRARSHGAQDTAAGIAVLYSYVAPGDPRGGSHPPRPHHQCDGERRRTAR